ncbi:glycosyl transferase family 2 [Bacillus sp. 3103sda1]|uniref:glycosyl transferase family 2 n=1 Tax=Bacillus sp. 3103sda1 TaxID=2953808 RepID=UPI00209F1D7B|nr:glycosyl transferase family 2 [Bacillus sp. 3103sda1]MCP1126081.1 glycosyl transferase family 2 [Bacillus sp. 3103sda1]
MSSLLNELKKIHINYKQINDFQLIYDSPFLLKVEWDQTNYEFFIHLKSNTPNLLVFGSGAYNAQKLKPPIFHRYSWTNHFDDSMIFYNDPTLYLGPINLGWGFGTANEFYLQNIATILQVIMKRIEIESNKVLFYGTSGGGFMSLILAGFVKGSTSLVNNPQTIIPNYYQSHVNLLFKSVHPNLTREEIIKRFSDRLNVLEFYKKIQYIPKIHYIQNVLCDHDMQQHVLPFIAGLQEIDENAFSNQVHLEFYANKEEGHNPLSLEKSIHYIQAIKP